MEYLENRDKFFSLQKVLKSLLKLFNQEVVFQLYLG